MWSYTQFKDKKCTMCGKTFTPNSGSQRVCGPECAATRQRRYERSKNGCKPLANVKCTECGKIFKQRSFNHTACSDKCKDTRARRIVMERRQNERNEGMNNGIRRDIKWNMSSDPWDNFKSGCCGFVRDVDLCPLG